MSVRIFLTFFLLVTSVFAADSAGPADSDPFKLLVYNLLDLDQSELFEPQQHSPLAEFHAWTNLYVALRNKAQTDTTDDRRHLKSFLLVGWIARVKNHFATVEAFNSDFMELFESKPEDTLAVLSTQNFLLLDMCTYLAKYFFFEKNDPDGRQRWEARHRGQMEAVLGPDNTKRCFDAFWRVKF
jgi:hypothetical protein